MPTTHLNLDPYEIQIIKFDKQLSERVEDCKNIQLRSKKLLSNLINHEKLVLEYQSQTVFILSNGSWYYKKENLFISFIII